jgi:hypothetical protein
MLSCALSLSINNHLSLLRLPQVKIFTEKTAKGRAMRLEGSGFVAGGDGGYVRVYLAWGLEPRDFSACHKTDYFCAGVQQWDAGFDLNTPPAQLALRVSASFNGAV